MSIARLLALGLLWIFTVGTGLCALMGMTVFVGLGGRGENFMLGVAALAAMCCCLGYAAIRALRRKDSQAKPEEHP